MLTVNTSGFASIVTMSLSSYCRRKNVMRVCSQFTVVASVENTRRQRVKLVEFMRTSKIYKN